EQLDAARRLFEQRLNALVAWMPALEQKDNTWHKFLFWDESRQLASSQPGPAPTNDTFDRLEMRWAGAPAGWGENRMFETSLAAQNYIRLVRGYLAGESREQHAAAWRELGVLLGSLGPQRSDTSKAAAAVDRRERLGEGSKLTSSIRRELSRPNLIVQIRED